MAFCTKCGKELEGGASVCPNCGAPVPSAAPSAPAVQLKTNRGLIKYILLSITPSASTALSSCRR